MFQSNGHMAIERLVGRMDDGSWNDPTVQVVRYLLAWCIAATINYKELKWVTGWLQNAYWKDTHYFPLNVRMIMGMLNCRCFSDTKQKKTTWYFCHECYVEFNIISKWQLNTEQIAPSFMWQTITNGLSVSPSSFESDHRPNIFLARFYLSCTLHRYPIGLLCQLLVINFNYFLKGLCHQDFAFFLSIMC